MMSEDSLDQHQYQQAKEARELEDMLNMMTQATSNAFREPEGADLDLARLTSLGVDIPRPQAPVAELPAPVAEPVQVPVQQQVDPSLSPVLDQGLGSNYWQQQAETLQRRKAEADRSLAPAQQKAARLEKTLEENNAAMSLLLKEIQELKSTRGSAQQTPAPDATWYDPSQDAEFASLNPEMAQRLAYIAKQSKDAIEDRERKFQERLDALQAEQNKRKEQEELQQLNHRATLQYSAIKQAHPDVDEFVAGSPKGQQLWEWATKPGMPIEYGSIVSEPTRYSAEMVIQVLNFFKNSSTPTQPQRRSPSLADIANPVLASSSSALSQPVNPVEEFLTPDQMRRAESILNSEEMRMDPAKANSFMEKMIRTEMRNATTRS